MCGRTVWVWDAKTRAMVRLLDDHPTADVQRVLEKNRYNVPPGSHLPVIRRQGTSGFVVARWGFPIPQRPQGVFNTRIESAYESPLWRGLIGKHHCVLPVRGFYEWRRPEKAPYFVHRPDGELMLLGGVVGELAVAGAKELCFSVVTTAPSAEMAPLHDRMPVILEPRDMADWLVGERTLDLATPSNAVAFHEVGREVNSTAHDDPSLMEPVRDAQSKLF